MIEFHCLLDYIQEHSDNIPHIKAAYLRLLTELTTVNVIDTTTFITNIENIHTMGRIMIGISEDKMVCSGTIIIEPKIIHGGKSAGHIEDIVVLESWRGKGLGSALVDHLVTYGFNHGCYKIILDCQENKVAFYEKSGFSKKGVQMSLYEGIN